MGEGGVVVRGGGFEGCLLHLPITTYYYKVRHCVSTYIGACDYSTRSTIHALHTSPVTVGKVVLSMATVFKPT